MFAAHDDRFFRTGVHTESAIDAAHHIDVEPKWKFFDLGIRMFAGFNIDALRGADRRAHVTRDTFQTSVASDGKNMCATKPFRIWTALLGIVDGGGVSFEQAGEQPPESDAKSTKCGPNRRVFETGS